MALMGCHHRYKYKASKANGIDDRGRGENIAATRRAMAMYILDEISMPCLLNL